MKPCCKIPSARYCIKHMLRKCEFLFLYSGNMLCQMISFIQKGFIEVLSCGSVESTKITEMTTVTTSIMVLKEL